MNKKTCAICGIDYVPKAAFTQFYEHPSISCELVLLRKIVSLLEQGAPTL